eukprot:Partr_v1_DN25447_c0_g1_i2_m53744 putative Protein phosphatase type 1 complex subunit Hex2 Reg1
MQEPPPPASDLKLSSSPPPSNLISSRRRRKQPSMPSSLPSAAYEPFNVDYFSHNWDEFDLKASWSKITKHKKTYIDGIRLENASWRKWMQQRLNLRKVSPESLRWKKDEDITWLYGPFCKTTFDSDKSSIYALYNIPQYSDIKARPSSSLAHSVIVDGVVHTERGEQLHDRDEDYLTARRYESADASVSVASTPGGVPSTYLPPSSPGRGFNAAKKSSLKSRSVVTDLKKFHDQANRYFPESMRVNAPNIVLSGKVNMQHSISDSDIYELRQRYLNHEERRLLLDMDKGPPIVSAIPEVLSRVSENASVVTASKSRDKRGRLRFSSEVQVLEYDTDLRISTDSLTSISRTSPPASFVPQIPSNSSSVSTSPALSHELEVSAAPPRLDSMDASVASVAELTISERTVATTSSSWTASLWTYAGEIASRFYK